MIEARKADGIMVVEFNGWERDAGRQLAMAWADLEDDDALAAAVLHFSGFGAPNETGDGSRAGVDLQWDALPLSIHKPVLAAIEGQCYGHNFELALCCDLRIAADNTSLGLPLRDDIYAIAPVLLPRSTFSGLSLELLTTGRTLSSRDALAARLVNRLTSAGRALPFALETASSLIARFTAIDMLRKRELLDLSGLPLPYVMSRVRTPNS
jgi:enoyl-CoA hydratase/carnithine racemase